MTFSIFDCDTRERVSDQSYPTADEANHDYYMNAGHTFVGVIQARRGKAFDFDSSRFKQALVRGVCDIGHLAHKEKLLLERAVRLGYLSKGKGGPFPMLKTMYARPGFDFAKDREASIAEMRYLATIDAARGVSHCFPPIPFQPLETRLDAARA